MSIKETVDEIIMWLARIGLLISVLIFLFFLMSFLVPMFFNTILPSPVPEQVVVQTCGRGMIVATTNISEIDTVLAKKHNTYCGIKGCRYDTEKDTDRCIKLLGGE